MQFKKYTLDKQQVMELTGWNLGRVNDYTYRGILSKDSLRRGTILFNMYNREEVLAVLDIVNNYITIKEFAKLARCSEYFIDDLASRNISCFPKRVINEMAIKGTKIFKRDAVEMFLKQYDVHQFSRRKTGADVGFTAPTPTVKLFGVSYAV